MSNIVAKTEELVKPICEAAQVDLVDVEYVKEGQVFFLRVYVDTPEGIDIDQCATIAEALSEKLDQHDYTCVYSEDDKRITITNTSGGQKKFKVLVS